MMNKLKNSLRLKIPAWMANFDIYQVIAWLISYIYKASLWIVALLLFVLAMPESIQSEVAMIVFIAFFPVQYFVPRYLEQAEKSGQGDSFLVRFFKTLERIMSKIGDFFWWAVGVVVFLVGLLLFFLSMSGSESSKTSLATYINIEDPYENPNSITINKYASGAQRIKKILLAIQVKSLACGYVIQEKLLVDCDSTQLIEVDNERKTMEVLITGSSESDCTVVNCNMLLLQISDKHFSAFANVLGDEKRTQNWVYEADVIANWGGVIIPIEIHAETYEGWHQLKIQYQTGDSESWQFTNSIVR